jgi:hypothetical protein
VSEKAHFMEEALVALDHFVILFRAVEFDS